MIYINKNKNQIDTESRRYNSVVSKRAFEEEAPRDRIVKLASLILKRAANSADRERKEEAVRWNFMSAPIMQAMDGPTFALHE